MTNKYGIIIRNWPLKTFISPGKIGSTSDLEVLYYAFKNGVTTFYKMTPAELEAWREERARGRLPSQTACTDTANPIAADTGTASSIDNLLLPSPSATTIPPPPETSSSADSSSPPLLTPPMNPGAALPGGSEPIFQTVFTISGDNLVTKKARRKRKDAGVKKGPNKRTAERLAREAAAAVTES